MVIGFSLVFIIAVGAAAGLPPTIKAGQSKASGVSMARPPSMIRTLQLLRAIS
jgi:hypothetical protein